MTMRLIDADALTKKLQHLWNIHDDVDFNNKDVWDELASAPTIDAVEVVRCKDCVENDAKYGNEENWCLKFGYTMHDDDFCSYGERETNEYSK